MTDMSLQGHLQQAVRKVSQIQQVAEAVTRAAAADYLRCSDLILNPGVYPLVKDANALSCILSEAYRRKMIGRVHAPLGKERFAYGARSDTAVAAGIKPNRRGAIRPSEPAVLGYELRVRSPDPRNVLLLLAAHPGARHEVDESTGLEAWAVVIPVPHKAAALDLLLAGDFLRGGVSVNPVLEK